MKIAGKRTPLYGWHRQTQALGLLVKRNDPCMAIHREESQIDCGRIEGQLQNVRSASGALGTYSWIQDVLAADNPAAMGLDEKPQDLYQYEERP